MDTQPIISSIKLNPSQRLFCWNQHTSWSSPTRYCVPRTLLTLRWPPWHNLHTWTTVASRRKANENSAAQKAFKIDLLLDLTESDDLTLQCLNNSFATLQISRKILRQKKVYHHVMWFTSAVNTQPLAHSVFSARVLDLVTSGLCLPWRDTGAGKNVLICQNYPNSPVDPGPARLILPPSGTLKHCLSALNIPDRPSPSRSTPRHTI